MLVAIGFVIVIFSVLGGFAFMGGHLVTLWQPVEILIIGGGALGAFVVSNTPSILKATGKALGGAFQPRAITKAFYMSLMALRYEILTKVRKVSNAELGVMIAAALVGTFLGILLAYGFVGPLASIINHKIAESSKPFECVKTTLLASLNGYSPALAVEFGRKVLYSTERPTFIELEEHVKSTKGK
ncbi:MAG: motility-associated protein [Limnobacter sp.]